MVQALTNGLSEREANDALTANVSYLHHHNYQVEQGQRSPAAVLQVCKGQQQHEEVCLGLFMLVLIEPPQAQRVSLTPP